MLTGRDAFSNAADRIRRLHARREIAGVITDERDGRIGG